MLLVLLPPPPPFRTTQRVEFTGQTHSHPFASHMSSGTPANEERGHDESAPLLQNDHDAAENAASRHRVPVHIARRLYVSHFLSTWNSRVFEFGAVLYLATIFPGTLLPMSVYALTRGFSAIVFASAVGHYIDVGNRLQVVRVSIGETLGP